MYQNYFKKCDGISLHTDDSKEFEYAQSQNKGTTFHHFNKEDVIFTHEDTKKLLELPYVVLDESDDEELIINGKTVCCHKHLYPVDVLNALDECGIINFVKE